MKHRSSAPLMIDFVRDYHGRWIAEIRELPGALGISSDKAEAEKMAKSRALQLLAARIQNGCQDPPCLDGLFRKTDHDKNVPRP